MNTTRQDAWSKEEDAVLTNTVLEYIRIGNTQLEAFKKVASELSRTPAACGFRWNATLRKECAEAIQDAKEDRKKGNKPREPLSGLPEKVASDQIESTISFLEKMKTGFLLSSGEEQRKQQMQIETLRKENENLKRKAERLRKHLAGDRESMELGNK
ncbi:RsfA family transcriptional regulator [Virgibacillus halophilus]|uniref:RsfA family transcriptional regulator n=1 Tax=Tigheibacillus halophilus TaxID=361280 RepID=A0ABU5CCB8_9BACI|nr:RsfA family transcriptional regulator [Virgibacillus halophilus]